MRSADWTLQDVLMMIILAVFLAAMWVYGLTTAEAIPVRIKRIPGENVISGRDLKTAYRKCESVWNKSFRSGGRIRLRSKNRCLMPELKGHYALDDWKEKRHFNRAWRWLAVNKVNGDIPHVFVFPPLVNPKDDDLYYAGWAEVGGYHDDERISGYVKPALATVHIHGDLRKNANALDISAAVICHELAHTIFGSVHTEGGIMGSPKDFRFTELSIARANRLIRKWRVEKKEGLWDLKKGYLQ